MKKYLKTYSALLMLNMSNMFAYRANFINSIIGSVGWATVSISSIFLLTSKTSSVFGWDRQELLLLVGIYNILNGMFIIFFARNFERFSKLIHFAQLDSILLKPIDSQFQISLSLFNITGLARVIIGIIFCWFIAPTLHIHLSIVTEVFFLLFLAVSMIIFYSVWFLVMTLIIWFSNLSNLADFLYVFNNLGRYPSQLITSLRNVFLFALLPFTLLASVPAKLLLSKLTIQDFIVFTSIAFGLLILSRIFWKFALRYYTSASS